jgi:outer membrane protein assembly factor BamA
MKHLHLSLIWLLVVSFWLTSCANQKAMVGKPISSLEIRHLTPKYVNNQRILKFISSQPTTVFSEEKLTEDVRSLYESGLVEDVRFSAKPDGKSVRLVVAVSTRQGSGPVLFVGNTSFSDKKLWEQISNRHMKRIKRMLDHPLDLATDKPIVQKDEKFLVEVLPAVCGELENFYRRQGYGRVRVTTGRWNGGPATPESFLFVIQEDASNVRNEDEA